MFICAGDSYLKSQANKKARIKSGPFYLFLFLLRFTHFFLLFLHLF